MAAQVVVVDLDFLNGQHVLGVLLEVLSARPSSPAQGRLFFNSTAGYPELYTGSAWIGLQDWTLSASSTNTASKLVQRDGSGDFAAHNITANAVLNLADPVNPQDAANKRYVDALVTGLDWKASARAATTAALAANTYNNGAGTLTANANGALAAVDGVTLVAADRLLVKNEATGSHNGLYVVTQVGDGSNPYVLTRTTDADTAAEVTSGMVVPIEEGTANDNTLWILTTNNPITLGTTALTFSSIGVTTYTAGNGLTLVGNQFAVVPGNGILADGTSTRIDISVVARHAAFTIGDGAATSITCTHNFGTRDVQVQVYRNGTPWDTVLTDVERTDTNNVAVKFNTAPASNAYRVVIIG